MRIEASGPRPVDDSWEQYTRPAAWAEWAPQIRSVRGVGGRIAAGDRGVVHGPFPVRVPFTIVSVDPDARRWRWRVGIRPVTVVLDHGVDPVEPGGTGGTTAWADVHAPALLVRAYAPLARLALRRLVGG
ncbi:SRPBCC family protein [Nocardioides sp. Soil805]|uniref:SRPBCC family protein n=1 Tax=Nocardioides sp. Soil805 TaxID=1736416 RepID=UPI0019104054|nr:SRPBCC family protein [Nocardioides sp. Soil805]